MEVNSCWKWGLHVLRLHRSILPLANPILLLKAADLPPAQGIHSGCTYEIIEASQVPFPPTPFLSSVGKRGRTHNHIPSVVLRDSRQWFISFDRISKSFLCHFGILAFKMAQGFLARGRTDQHQELSCSFYGRRGARRSFIVKQIWDGNLQGIWIGKLGREFAGDLGWKAVKR